MGASIGSKATHAAGAERRIAAGSPSGPVSAPEQRLAAADNRSLTGAAASGSAAAEPCTAGAGQSLAAAERLATAERLKITEIFLSIQGEALTSGWPTVFVRLTGCPLRCGYCDTAYAFGGGEWRTIDEILAEVGGRGARYVCVTGGEPLAQPRCATLLASLCDAGYEVSLETSGALDITEVDPRVSRIVDIKTPASGEVERNRWENLAALTDRDAVKLVICNHADYEWAKGVLARHPDLPCTVFFSPSYRELEARDLADWIVADRLRVRLQVQLHKALWGDVPGR